MTKTAATTADRSDKTTKSDAEWRAQLTAET